MSEEFSDYFTTADGENVWISGLVCRGTYENCWEGDERGNSCVLRERGLLEADAKREFPHLQAVLIFDDLQPELPLFRWQALLQSHISFSRNPDFQTQLGIVWFTDTLPDHLHSQLRALIARIEWRQVAEEYDFLL